MRLSENNEVLNCNVFEIVLICLLVLSLQGSLVQLCIRDSPIILCFPELSSLGKCEQYNALDKTAGASTTAAISTSKDYCNLGEIALTLPSPPSSNANGMTRSEGKKKKVLMYLLHVGPFTSWLFNSFQLTMSTLGEGALFLFKN